MIKIATSIIYLGILELYNLIKAMTVVLCYNMKLKIKHEKKRRKYVLSSLTSMKFKVAYQFLKYFI